MECRGDANIAPPTEPEPIRRKRTARSPAACSFNDRFPQARHEPGSLSCGQTKITQGLIIGPTQASRSKLCILCHDIWVYLSIETSAVGIDY